MKLTSILLPAEYTAHEFGLNRPLIALTVGGLVSLIEIVFYLTRITSVQIVPIKSVLLFR